MKKKVLFLSAWYPTRYDPMPGLFVQRHAEVLTDDFDVALLHTLAVESFKTDYEIEILTENKVYTVRVYYPKVSNKLPCISLLIKIWRFYKAHQKGFKEILKHQGVPDLVHVNILTRVGIYALFLKIFYRIPYVITEHWSRYLPERNWRFGSGRKVLTKLVVRNSSAISTVSEKLKAEMSRCDIRHLNFSVIKNIVDCNLFRPLQLPSSNPKIFSHISCFDNQAKNITGIIHSVFELSKHRKDFICLMVGEGEEKTKAEHLVDQLNLNNYIKFTGLLEGEALVKAYSQSVFTVLFSNYENMPVVIAESFACGRPVIATKVGGIPEVVDYSNGLLIDAGDEIALTNALNSMLNNYETYNAEQIRNYAISLFSKEAVKSQLLELYKFCFSEKK